MKGIKKLKSDVVLNIEGKDSTLPIVLSSSFHDDTRLLVILAQFFGVMPIHGIRHHNINNVKFQWKSFRVLYSICTMIGGLFSSTFCVLRFAKYGVFIDEVGILSFYVFNFIGMIMLFQIACNWTKILHEFAYVELSMRSYGELPNLKRKLYINVVTIMTLSVVEHLLFILNNLDKSSICENFPNYPTEIYFGIAFPHVFTVIGYSHWIAILTEVTNVLCTFIWNFIDVFIIFISCCIRARFEQIVRRLKTNKLTLHEKYWREIREDYNKLAHLVHTVDKYIASLVLISYANNIFFLCIQLYNSTKDRQGLVKSFYFFYSFAFLVARLMAVSMYGALLHDETKKPLDILHNVPSEHFCLEINRLIEQITSSPIGLTGSRFFIVTRSFILQMAGTIVTFELMVFQFGPGMNPVAKVDTNECIK